MQRAYIYLNRHCNLACTFCASDETNNRNLSIDGINSIKEFIKDASLRCDSIVISGGEPTLHPKLPDIISSAVKFFKNVQLMTNGLSFANKKYMQTVISRGLTDVCIPVISPDPVINNKLVGRGDGYQLQAKGIHNLLASDWDVKPNIHFKTIVQSAVLDSFDKFPEYFTSLPLLPDFFIVNGLHIGKKVLMDPSIIPDYAKAGRRISKLVVSLSGLDMVVAIAEFPLCLLSVEAINVLVQSKFPISAGGIDTIIIDREDVSCRIGNHIKESFCSSRCLAHNVCDGLPSKNFEVIRDQVLNLLRPIVVE